MSFSLHDEFTRYKFLPPLGVPFHPKRVGDPPAHSNDIVQLDMGESGEA